MKIRGRERIRSRSRRSIAASRLLFFGGSPIERSGQHAGGFPHMLPLCEFRMKTRARTTRDAQGRAGCITADAAGQGSPPASSVTHVHSIDAPGVPMPGDSSTGASFPSGLARCAQRAARALFRTALLWYGLPARSSLRPSPFAIHGFLPPAPPAAPTDERPNAGGAPPVLFGPGGDYVTPWPREDRA